MRRRSVASAPSSTRAQRDAVWGPWTADVGDRRQRGGGKKPPPLRRRGRRRASQLSSSSSSSSSCSSYTTTTTTTTTTSTTSTSGYTSFSSWCTSEDFRPARRSKLQQWGRRGRKPPAPSAREVAPRSWVPVGEPGVHLASISLFPSPGSGFLAAYNPQGRCSASESPTALLDGFRTTRWLDPTLSPLYLLLPAPVVPTFFTFTTAYCDPSKDPVLWTLHGAHIEGLAGAAVEEDEMKRQISRLDDSRGWRVLHDQASTLYNSPLLRGAETTPPFACLEGEEVNVIRFCTLKVRGSMREWREAVRQSAAVRRSFRPPSPSSRRRSTAAAKPGRSSNDGSDRDDKECTFSPVTNYSKYGPNTPRTRRARLDEMCKKGSDKIRATLARPRKRTHPSTQSLAKSAELYDKALELRQRRQDREAACKRDMEMVSVSKGKKSDPAVQAACFEELYNKAEEMRERRETRRRLVEEEEALLRGDGRRVVVTEDPWNRLYHWKPKYPLPPKRNPSSEELEECTFSPQVNPMPAYCRSRSHSPVGPSGVPAPHLSGPRLGRRGTLPQTPPPPPSRKGSPGYV